MSRTALLLPFLFPLLVPHAEAQMQWVRMDSLSGGGHRMVYDSSRERLVLFGGSLNGHPLDETWEWDGVGWTLRETDVRPPARGGHAMAYDAARRRVVLFGGQSSQGKLSDTWEWDGSTWTELTPTSAPRPRHGHAMAYDALRQRTLLFGGCVSEPDSDLSDTWEWDGSEWTLLTPQSSPFRRCSHEMAYDEQRQRVVLFGGHTRIPGGSESHTDTWEWNGTTWIQRFPAAHPQFTGSLAYDCLRGRMVLFRPAFQSLVDPETWEWDGAEWIQLLPSQSPFAGGAMAFDAARGQTVFLSGSDGVPTRTWGWDGTDWAPVTPVLSPPGHVSHDMVYDSSRERVVMFAGQDVIGAPTGTWEWDGRAWSLREPAVSPKGRRSHAMAYDSARKVTVLYGGDGGPGETWEWDGTTWTQRSPAHGPPLLLFHAMTYDSVRQRVVLFGGTEALSGDHVAGTWEWDGTDWLERTPPVSPSARSYAEMVYDAARQRVVLFGGLTRQGLVGDTWEWDGSDWTERSPAGRPVVRAFHAMAYDTHRERVVMFGGIYKGPLDETWEWDGTTWSQLSTASSPPGRGDTAMAYDAARRRMVLFGGSGPITEVQRTWILGETRAGAVEEYGSGCTGSRGRPRLAIFGKPSLGNRSFSLDLSSTRPGAPALLAISTASASQPFGVCTLLVDPGAAVSLPAASNQWGFASAGLPVPEVPELIGLELYAQGIVFDPAGSFGFLAASNGLVLRVGE